MSIWDNLLRRAISPIIKESIDKFKKETVEKGLQVQEPSNFYYYPPAGVGKPSAANTRLYPRGYSFKTLRDFALYYPILRSCVNYRKRQITQLEWDVGPTEVKFKKEDVDKADKEAKQIKEFLKYPTGDKSVTFRTFLNRILEDILVLDAVSIYRRKNLKGGLYGFLPVDATTIELLLNEDGTVPQPPDPAYVQKIRGEVKEQFTLDEMVYRMMNPRTNTPYGLSAVETLIITVSTALKLSTYNLNFLTEGNVPEGFVELPKDVASNQDQLRLWQEAWDAMFSGNPKFTRKIKFLPEGMKYTPLRKSEDMEFEKFDKWLLLQTCSVMEVAPQAIGFQFERGKGATEMEWEIGKERGMYPLAHFIKEIMDQIIQEDLGKTDFEFHWNNMNPTNKKEEAEVFSKLVTTGAVSIDEWRVGEGLTPIGLAHYIMTPVGPIFVKDFVGASERGTPLIPYNYQRQGGANSTLSGAKKPNVPTDASGDNNNQSKPGYDLNSVTPPPKKTPGQQKTDIETDLHKYDREDVIEELKRWKKVAVKDFKAGMTPRDFKSDIIDLRTQKVIKDGVRSAETKEDLDSLFNPLITKENDIIDSVLKLHEQLSEIVKNETSDSHQTTTDD
jgi:HK97 family phage portal protein